MVAVVTGASRGIGKATAEELSRNGYRVIALSRTPCPVAGVESKTCDVTDPEQVRAAFADIERIDLLVNNAGFGISGAAEYTSAEDLHRQFELNVFALTLVTQCALPALKAAKGRILNISSAAAVFPIPFQSFYSASKAAVESLTGAWRSELAAFGVSVGALRLGDVKTGFTAARQKTITGDDEYGGKISRSVAVMERDEQNGMAPEQIAEAVVRAAKRKRMPLITTVGAKYKFFCALAKLLPAGAVNRIVRMMYIPK